MSAYILPDTDESLIIVFDATLAEGHEFTSEVTEHPVETGSNIADHVRQNPEALTLTVRVSNTPIEDLGRGSITTTTLDVPRYTPPLLSTPGSLFSAAGSALTNLLSGGATPVKIQSMTFPEPFDRIKEVYTQLKELWAVSATMSVVTSLFTYTNMVLTSVGIPRDEPGAATITISVKQIKTVETENVTAPKPAEKRGAPTKAKGAQATKPEESVKAQSILSKVTEALGL